MTGLWDKAKSLLTGSGQDAENDPKAVRDLDLTELSGVVGGTTTQTAGTDLSKLSIDYALTLAETGATAQATATQEGQRLNGGQAIHGGNQGLADLVNNGSMTGAQAVSTLAEEVKNYNASLTTPGKSVSLLAEMTQLDQQTHDDSGVVAGLAGLVQSGQLKAADVISLVEANSAHGQTGAQGVILLESANPNAAYETELGHLVAQGQQSAAGAITAVEAGATQAGLSPMGGLANLDAASQGNTAVTAEMAHLLTNSNAQATVAALQSAAAAAKVDPATLLTNLEAATTGGNGAVEQALGKLLTAGNAASIATAVNSAHSGSSRDQVNALEQIDQIAGGNVALEARLINDTTASADAQSAVTVLENSWHNNNAKSIDINLAALDQAVTQLNGGTVSTGQAGVEAEIVRRFNGGQTASDLTQAIQKNGAAPDQAAAALVNAATLAHSSAELALEKLDQSVGFNAAIEAAMAAHAGAENMTTVVQTLVQNTQASQVDATLLQFNTALGGNQAVAALIGSRLTNGATAQALSAVIPGTNGDATPQITLITKLAAAAQISPIGPLAELLLASRSNNSSIVKALGGMIQASTTPSTMISQLESAATQFKVAPVTFLSSLLPASGGSAAIQTELGALIKAGADPTAAITAIEAMATASGTSPYAALSSLLTASGGNAQVQAAVTANNPVTFAFSAALTALQNGGNVPAAIASLEAAATLVGSAPMDQLIALETKVGGNAQVEAAMGQLIKAGADPMTAVAAIRVMPGTSASTQMKIFSGMEVASGGNATLEVVLGALVRGGTDPTPAIAAVQTVAQASGHSPLAGLINLETASQGNGAIELAMANRIAQNPQEDAGPAINAMLSAYRFSTNAPTAQALVNGLVNFAVITNGCAPAASALANLKVQNSSGTISSFPVSTLITQIEAAGGKGSIDGTLAALDKAMNGNATIEAELVKRFNSGATVTDLMGRIKAGLTLDQASSIVLAAATQAKISTATALAQLVVATGDNPVVVSNFIASFGASPSAAQISGALSTIESAAKSAGQSIDQALVALCTAANSSSFAQAARTALSARLGSGDMAVNLASQLQNGVSASQVVQLAQSIAQTINVPDLAVLASLDAASHGNATVEAALQIIDTSDHPNDRNNLSGVSSVAQVLSYVTAASNAAGVSPSLALGHIVGAIAQNGGNPSDFVQSLTLSSTDPLSNVALFQAIEAGAAGAAGAKGSEINGMAGLAALEVAVHGNQQVEAEMARLVQEGGDPQIAIQAITQAAANGNGPYASATAFSGSISSLGPQIAALAHFAGQFPNGNVAVMNQLASLAQMADNFHGALAYALSQTLTAATANGVTLNGIAGIISMAGQSNPQINSDLSSLLNSGADGSTAAIGALTDLAKQGIPTACLISLIEASATPGGGADSSLVGLDKALGGDAAIEQELTKRLSNGATAIDLANGITGGLDPNKAVQILEAAATQAKYSQVNALAGLVGATAGNSVAVSAFDAALIAAIPAGALSSTNSVTAAAARTTENALIASTLNLVENAALVSGQPVDQALLALASISDPTLSSAASTQLTNRLGNGDMAVNLASILGNGAPATQVLQLAQSLAAKAGVPNLAVLASLDAACNGNATIEAAMTIIDESDHPNSRNNLSGTGAVQQIITDMTTAANSAGFSAANAIGRMIGAIGQNGGDPSAFAQSLQVGTDQKANIQLFQAIEAGGAAAAGAKGTEINGVAGLGALEGAIGGNHQVEAELARLVQEGGDVSIALGAITTAVGKSGGLYQSAQSFNSEQAGGNIGGQIAAVANFAGLFATPNPAVMSKLVGLVGSADDNKGAMTFALSQAEASAVANGGSAIAIVSAIEQAGSGNPVVEAELAKLVKGGADASLAIQAIHSAYRSDQASVTAMTALETASGGNILVEAELGRLVSVGAAPAAATIAAIEATRTGVAAQISAIAALEISSGGNSAVTAELARLVKSNATAGASLTAAQLTSDQAALTGVELAASNAGQSVDAALAAFATATGNNASVTSEIKNVSAVEAAIAAAQSSIKAGGNAATAISTLQSAVLAAGGSVDQALSSLDKALGGNQTVESAETQRIQSYQADIDLQALIAGNKMTSAAATTILASEAATSGQGAALSTANLAMITSLEHLSQSSDKTISTLASQTLQVLQAPSTAGTLSQSLAGAATYLGSAVKSGALPLADASTLLQSALIAGQQAPGSAIASIESFAHTAQTSADQLLLTLAGSAQAIGTTYGTSLFSAATVELSNRLINGATETQLADLVAAGTMTAANATQLANHCVSFVQQNAAASGATVLMGETEAELVLYKLDNAAKTLISAQSYNAEALQGGTINAAGLAQLAGYDQSLQQNYAVAITAGSTLTPLVDQVGASVASLALQTGINLIGASATQGKESTLIGTLELAAHDAGVSVDAALDLAGLSDSGQSLLLKMEMTSRLLSGTTEQDLEARVASGSLSADNAILLAKAGVMLLAAGNNNNAALGFDSNTAESLVLAKLDIFAEQAKGAASGNAASNIATLQTKLETNSAQSVLTGLGADIGLLGNDPSGSAQLNEAETANAMANRLMLAAAQQSLDLAAQSNTVTASNADNVIQMIGNQNIQNFQTAIGLGYAIDQMSNNYDKSGNTVGTFSWTNAKQVAENQIDNLLATYKVSSGDVAVGASTGGDTNIGDGFSVTMVAAMNNGAQYSVTAGGVKVGATTGDIASVSVNLNNNMQVMAVAEAIAAGSVKAGLSGVSVTGNAQVGAQASVSGQVQGNIGNGFDGMGSAKLEAGFQESANGSVSIGLTEDKLAVGALSGAYVAAGLDGSVSKYGVTVEAGATVISPGSVGVKLDDSISLSGGDLQIGLNQTIDAEIGGFKLNLNFTLPTSSIVNGLKGQFTSLANTLENAGATALGGLEDGWNDFKSLF